MGYTVAHNLCSISRICDPPLKANKPTHQAKKLKCTSNYLSMGSDGKSSRGLSTILGKLAYCAETRMNGIKSVMQLQVHYTMSNVGNNS